MGSRVRVPSRPQKARRNPGFFRFQACIKWVRCPVRSIVFSYNAAIGYISILYPAKHEIHILVSYHSGKCCPWLFCQKGVAAVEIRSALCLPRAIPAGALPSAGAFGNPHCQYFLQILLPIRQISHFRRSVAINCPGACIDRDDRCNDHDRRAVALMCMVQELAAAGETMATPV